jgi:superfamily I DNA/RNA helicase/mRNA-degrading endonuclease RelE of RelBE toxin-antitoxin system
VTARLSLYQKAEQELYKLDRSVKAKFYDFCHKFRENPHLEGLRLKQLKGDGRVYSARIDDAYRALLAPMGRSAKGEEDWLLVAVRHRKDVYDQLSLAVNRVTGEIEFVDLSVVGQSALRRAGITLTPDEAEPAPEPVSAPASVVPDPQSEPAAPPAPSAGPLLADYTSDQLREFGVAESLISVALKITSSVELDQLVRDAPLLSRDILYGLAAGMNADDVLTEITGPVKTDAVDTDDYPAALRRTTVTILGSRDDDLAAALEDSDFRAWKVYLHPTQRKLAYRDYTGPARVSGGPGTGKTIVALHHAKHLAEALPPGHDKPILLTTFTKNLATDLRARLASLLDPATLDRIDIAHVDQLAARVLGESASAGRGVKRRIDDAHALAELQALLVELGQREFDALFLLDEWEQVILGQALTTRAAYFQARRNGRGRLNRAQRDKAWRVLEQLVVRLDKSNQETWAQAAERAALFEMDRAARIARRKAGTAKVSDRALAYQDDDSDWGYREYRYQHIIVDEAQDLRPSHWKMLRAMVGPGPNDLFLVGDTHQRIYDSQASLSALGINIVGRSARLTLSYRTTKEILITALGTMAGQSYDNLDDGHESLGGYRSILTGPTPQLRGYSSWAEELDALADTITAWRTEQGSGSGANGTGSADGRIAIAVAERDKVNEVMWHLKKHADIDCAELTKDGPRGSGEVHVGTMHRFKGLEYQKLAVVAVCDGVLPHAAIERYHESDPARYQRELKKARSLLFVAETRARDDLAISWHGRPSPLLPTHGKRSA